MSTVSSALVNMQNTTAMEQAKQTRAGDNTEITADMFLKLMMEQLKYQDPLDPVSNTEFLSQQATFSQLQELMELNSETTAGNSVQQALNLVGKEVTIKDPDKEGGIITGVVQEASFDEDTPTIMVGDKKYPITSVVKVAQIDAESEATKQNTENINSIKETLAGLTGNFTNLSETVGTISNKLQEYLN